MSEHLVQVLSEDGRLIRRPDPSLSQEELKKLYRMMVLVRCLEDRAIKAQRQGRIGFFIGCRGQEASIIGSAAALEPQDWIFPAYRQHAIPLLRGIPLQSLVDNLYGNARDIVKGRQMPCHYSFRQINFVSISSPIGTQIIQAVGAAMAAKIRGDKIVVMTYFGDGGTSANDFHSGLNFAGVYQTPCVFFCENNHWAISVPVTAQTRSTTLSVKAQAYGFAGVRVDGNDILAVYEATRQAVDKARNGGGPTLIESLTFRLGAHSSSDDNTRYCLPELLDYWRKRDPVKRFKLFLQAEGLWDEGQEAELWQTSQEDVNSAFKEAEAVGPPPLESLFQDVYREMPPHLQTQWRALQQEQQRLGAPADTSQAFPL